MAPKFGCQIPEMDTYFVHSTVPVGIFRKEILFGTDSQYRCTVILID